MSSVTKTRKLPVQEWRDGKGNLHELHGTETSAEFNPELAEAIQAELPKEGVPNEKMPELIRAAVAKLETAGVLGSGVGSEDAGAPNGPETRPTDAKVEGLLWRRYLMAICLRDSGRFEHLDEQQLYEVSLVCRPPCIGFEDWKKLSAE